VVGGGRTAGPLEGGEDGGAIWAVEIGQGNRAARTKAAETQRRLEYSIVFRYSRLLN
jgi:hypothetical protein